MHHVRVQTLHDYDDDMRFMFQMWDEVRRRSDDVYLDFSPCAFLKNNAIAFFGGIANELERQKRRLLFSTDEMAPNVQDALTACGFLGAFGYNQVSDDPDSIPYRHDHVPDGEAILTYLTRHWLKEEWLYFDDELRYAIGGQLWEIYANAFEHAHAKGGVFTCGGHYSRSHTICLTVVDFGRGIPGNVRAFLRAHGAPGPLTGAQCLKWAFREGTSTAKTEFARGLGLSLLKSFVRKNRGLLQIFSDDGYAKVDESREQFYNMRVPFKGTLVNIVLYEEPDRYRLKDLTF